MNRIKTILSALSCATLVTYWDAHAQILDDVSGVPANLNATVDPTAGNDQTQGYQVGSIWQNANTGRVFIARSIATGAAVWTVLFSQNSPGYIANNWYIPSNASPIASGTAPGTGSIRIYPVFITERVTIQALGVRVTTTAAAGNVQAAIYKNNASTMRPTGTALASTSSMSTTTATSVNASISLQLDTGMYWFATNTDNATAAYTSFNSNQATMSNLIGSATQANDLGAGTALQGLSVAQTFNTWPDLTSASFTEVAGTTIPIVQFEIGSVP